jgi:hypothetical protein
VVVVNGLVFTTLAYASWREWTAND